MDENKNSQSQNPQKKHQIIKPSFYVDDERRVICESHSQIERIRTLSSLADLPAFQESREIEKILTCKACNHYHNDVCYFPKEEIDRIEKDRLAYTFNCKLCGGSIDRPLTVMYSIYNKEKFNVQIPLICCTCFSNLDDDSFIANSRKRILMLSLSFAFSIFMVIYYGRIAILSNIWGILLFGITLAFWIYLAIRDVRKIIFLFRGRKYYKKTYGIAKKRDKGKYVDEFPFD
ncbi:MAG: hypothetical protein EU530_00705 [Promethearchaeota archaeon]|nr:MAG: hypothetical protein EU530_00705 [Candidatus Lokiarchaeota archaeon]